MSKVEVEVVLLSFIWALAVTRILEGFAGLWIARARVTASVSHLGWMAAILLSAMLSWFPLVNWGERLQGWIFLAVLSYGVGLYFAATVVSPKVPEQGDFDLAGYESQEGGAYKITFITLMMLALPLEYALNGAPMLGQFIMGEWPVLATMVVYCIGLSRNVRIRTICAAMAVALAARAFALGLGLF